MFTLFAQSFPKQRILSIAVVLISAYLQRGRKMALIYSESSKELFRKGWASWLRA